MKFGKILWIVVFTWMVVAITYSIATKKYYWIPYTLFLVFGYWRLDKRLKQKRFKVVEVA